MYQILILLKMYQILNKLKKRIYQALQKLKSALKFKNRIVFNKVVYKIHLILN